MLSFRFVVLKKSTKIWILLFAVAVASTILGIATTSRDALLTGLLAACPSLLLAIFAALLLCEVCTSEPSWFKATQTKIRF